MASRPTAYTVTLRGPAPGDLGERLAKAQAGLLATPPAQEKAQPFTLGQEGFADGGGDSHITV
jgi:hypothetical protein